MRHHKKNGKKAFALNLKLLLKHHSLSLRKLAKAINLTYSYIAKLTNEQRIPSISVVEKISKIFQVSIAELFGEQEIDFKNRPKKLKLDFDEE